MTLALFLGNCKERRLHFFFGHYPMAIGDLLLHPTRYFMWKRELVLSPMDDVWLMLTFLFLVASPHSRLIGGKPNPSETVSS